MFGMEDKENESQQENEKAGKLLVAEPSGQRPRRSVLKEFDPFAPDSPCPPKKQTIKHPDGITIDEEEVFEDAETSLTSFVCPRNKHTDKSPDIEAPNKPGTRRSWLIGLDVKNNRQEELNPNDTADMSYVEAVENLSQVNEDKTSSEEDFEFNCKKPARNPEIIVQNSENDLLNITANIEKTNSINEENIMVDSLEHTVCSSNQLNSTIENVNFPVILNKTQAIEVQVNPNSSSNNVSVDLGKIKFEVKEEVEESVYEGPGSMTDSLELTTSQNIPNSIKEEHQENLIDSLEIFQSEENLESLNIKETPYENIDNIDKTSQIILKGNVTPKDNLSQYDKANTVIKTEQSSELDTSVKVQGETIIIKNSEQIVNIDINNANVSTEMNKTFEEVPSNTVESTVHQLQNDKTDTLNVNVELNKTFEAPILNIVESTVDQLQSEQISTCNVNTELNKTFEAPSPNTVESKVDQVESDQTNTSNVNVEPTKTFVAPSPNTVESKVDQVESDQINTSNVNVELNKTFEALSSNTIESSAEQLHDQVVNSSVNVELSKTFEAPTPNTVVSTVDQLQSEQTSSSNVNIDLNKIEFNKIFGALFPNSVESKVDQLQSDQTNTSNVNVELNETFEAPSPNTVECKVDEVQSNQTNTSSGNVELNKTFEAPPSNAIESSADQLHDQVVNSSVNVELSKTFKAPTPNTVESTVDQLQSEQTSTSNVNVELNKTQTDQLQINSSNTNDLGLTMKEVSNHSDQATIGYNEVLNKIASVGESKPIIVQASSIVECLNENSKCLEKTESEIQPKEECISSLKNTIEHNWEQEVTNPEYDPDDLQDRSVSLKDIIDINTSDKNNVKPDHENQTSSSVSSGFENDNSTVITEEQAAESSRVMEALAQSLNQTIDVEESAIIDDINSSKSTSASDGSSKELNITIENILEVSDNRNSVIKDTEEKNEEGKQNKILKRKDTEEFEDLERQYNEKTQNTGKDVDGSEIVIKNIDKDKANTVVEEDYSKVYQRQDTQEFEALERECNESAKNGNNVTENNLKRERDKKINDESKVIERQETQKFEDLERECTTNIQEPSETSKSSLNDNEKTIQELNVAIKTAQNNSEKINTPETLTKELVNGDVLMEKIDLPEKPVTGQVKVIVSGNICNANSVTEESDQKAIVKRHFTGINLKYDLINKEKHCNVEHEPINNVPETSTGVTINDNTDLITKKTDTALIKEIPTSTVIANDEIPRTSENMARPKNRLECRPSTRSLRNNTQVIDRPVSVSDTSKELKQEKYIKNSSLVPSEHVEKQLHEYKTKSEDLRNQVDKLKTEMETIKTDNMRKDKYILTCALDVEVERANVVKLRKVLEDYEQTVANQNEELRRLKEEEEKNAKKFTSFEMAFADVFEKYEKTKSIIGAYRKNEEILQRNIQCAEDQLTKLEAKCSVMKEQYKEKIKKVEDQMEQEKEKYRQDIAKLQAMVKRLEIKSSSLETSLKQKTEECRALSALCDDITGKPM